MKTKNLKTKANARKVLEYVDCGLVSGVGSPRKGEACIIATKRLAMGLSHGDEITGLPIGEAVREFEIALNDSGWSNNEARAKGMRRLSVAEWGSDEIDQKRFSELLALKTIQRIVPAALRSAANCRGQLPEWKTKLEAEAVKCELVKEIKAASAASDAASAARAAAIDARAAASDASYASAAASDAARAAASDAARAAASAAASAASDAASAARAAASAASYAASYAASAARAAAIAARAAASYANPDAFLIQIADIAVEVLLELHCKGCEWLDLCEAKGK